MLSVRVLAGLIPVFSLDSGPSLGVIRVFSLNSGLSLW